jgi:hypothetical protein
MSGVNVSLITGYGVEFCKSAGEGGGTNFECSGYNPSILGFGKLSPNLSTIEDDPNYSFTLPLNYAILNVRAELSTCLWWDGDVQLFNIDDISDTDSPSKLLNGKKNKFPTVKVGDHRCTRNDTNEFTKATFSNYPCNGSHTACPHYTGICWEYVTNDRLFTGRKVLAEQILELRYYVRESLWSKDSYDNSFNDPVINAWAGTKEVEISQVSDGHSLDVTYNVINTEIDFSKNKFEVLQKKELIHEGSLVKDGVDSSVNFPTLIKEVLDFLISPIPINNFYDHNGVNVFESNSSDNRMIIAGSNKTESYDSVCLNLTMMDVVPEVLLDLVEYWDNGDDINALLVACLGKPYDDNNCLSKSLFDGIMDDISSVIDTFRFYDVDFLHENTINNKSFIFDTAPIFGNNRFLIMSKYKSDDLYYWGFSIIDVYNTLVTGFMSQQSFSISKTKDGIVDRLYDYRRSMMGQEVTVEFEFLPTFDNGLVSYSYVDHLYNSFKSNDLLTQEVHTGYKKCVYYRRHECFNIKQVGSSPYIIIFIEDKLISSVYSTEFSNEDNTEDIFIQYVDGTICEMVVVRFGTNDGLLANQIMLKPVDINKFSSICRDEFVSIYTEVSYKYSFDYTVEDIEGWEYFVDDDSVAFSGGEMTRTFNRFTVKQFNFSIVATAIVVGPSGVPTSKVAMKLATWVKLPMVPDVEIQYSWSGDFGFYMNSPVCNCCGAYSRNLKYLTSMSYTPECGDHEVYGNRGKMWYPYAQCLQFSRYSKISNQIYSDINEVKYLYKSVDDSGERENGTWNMRMEGPPDHEFKTGNYCCSLCVCSCQCETYNYLRVEGTDNNFAGFCRYRGDVSNGTLKLWYDTGGGTPRFGNTQRPQLKSYRSTDYIQYKYLDYTPDVPVVRTMWMWMPAVMTFSDVDYISPETLYSDFCDDDVHPINSLNTMLFMSVDGHSLNEVVHDGRFRFEEVFSVHGTASDIAYPAPYSKTERSVPQYLAIDNKNVQSSWRQPDKEIDRNYNGDGILDFVTVTAPEYVFSESNIESRIRPDEGEHSISVHVPEIDSSTGEYDGDFLYIQLDNGLKRGFLNGFVNFGCDNSEEYNELTSFPWWNVDLFEDGHSDTVEEAIEAGKSFFIQGSNVYFNRGVNIIFNKMCSDTLELEYNLLTEPEYLPVEEHLMVGKENVVFSFGGIKKAISKGFIVFKYGIDEDDTLYCIPGIQIMDGEDEVFSSGARVPINYGLSEIEIAFDLNVKFDTIFNRSEEFVVKFDYDIGEKCIGGSPAFCTVVDVNLYDAMLTDFTESIYIHERKYKVSVSNGDETPPHGKSGEYVLRARHDSMEYDTVWQRDDSGEVVGLDDSSGEQTYIHKSRTRFVFDSVVDGEPLKDTLHNSESRQEKMYHKVMQKAVTNLSYSSIVFPGIDELLHRYNLYLVKPRSTGNMYNNAVYNIGSVKHYPKMSPKGYMLMPGEPVVEYCPRSWAGVEHCSGGDSFLYNRYNMDTGNQFTDESTGVDIFYNGTNLMVNRLKIAKFIASHRGDEYSASSSGKIFVDGDPINLLIPKFFNICGLYSVHDWYTPPQNTGTWPDELPGTWSRFGTNIFGNIGSTIY